MQVVGGVTNVTTYFALRLAADGTAAFGLTITDFDLQYVRSGAAPSAKADATALAATDSAHADNKAIEIDGTDQPALYRVDWPDAAFAAGVREVVLTVKVATCFTEHLAVQIDPPVDTTKWAGTAVVAGAIPAVAADGAGGLPVSDAGGLDLDTKLANTNEVTAARMSALTDWINGGRLDLILDIIAADVVNLDGAAMRGTDSAALASVATEARLAELDAANLPADNAAIAALIVTVDTVVDAIKAITDNLPDSGALTTIGTATARLTAVRAAVLTDWINGERLDLLLDAIKAITDNLPNSGALSDLAAILTDTAVIGAAGAGLTDLGGMSSGMKVEVNAEVADVTDTDTSAEPAQGAPPATASLRTKLDWLYKIAINKKTQTATKWNLYDDAGTTVDAKATVSADGTTATKEEIVSGP